MSCGELTTRSVGVKISQPEISESFNIEFYQVTYKPVSEGYSGTQIRDITYTDNTVTDVTEAVAGVTYNVSVVSRSGHLTSQAVMTTCTAGQFFIFSIICHIQQMIYGRWYSRLTACFSHLRK